MIAGGAPLSRGVQALRNVRASTGSDPGSNSAAAPATCGAAMEVPLATATALSDALRADVMSTPGANRSTQLPKFAQLGLVSDESAALTVIAARPPLRVRSTSAW